MTNISLGSKLILKKRWAKSNMTLSDKQNDIILHCFVWAVAIFVTIAFVQLIHLTRDDIEKTKVLLKEECTEVCLVNDEKFVAINSYGCFCTNKISFKSNVNTR